MRRGWRGSLKEADKIGFEKLVKVLGTSVTHLM
jgi:hypothetical protein